MLAFYLLGTLDIFHLLGTRNFYMGRFFVVAFDGNLDRKFVFLFHKSVFYFVALSCRNACIYWELFEQKVFCFVFVFAFVSFHFCCVSFGSV